MQRIVFPFIKMENFIGKNDSFTSVVVLIVLCLSVYFIIFFFGLLAPYVCYHF